MPRPIIIDTDPGIDDAVAILLALAAPELLVSGVVAVAGNLPLAATARNALSILELAGRPAIPVHAGCPRPMARARTDAEHAHGESGLGDLVLPPPTLMLRPQHGILYLIDTLRGAEPHSITICALGPLTNIAMAFVAAPDITQGIAELVIMGGASLGQGNVTPAAEFNIAADPEAAAIVFEAGWQVTMVGLDVTLQARATPDVQDRMRGLGRLGADLLLPGLLGFQGEPDQGDAAAGGPPVHDVCALALVAEPGLFGCDPARVDVETTGRWTAGMTVTDFSASPAARNALVAMRVDVPAFWDLVLSAYAKIPAASAAS
jgi:purine nucleosidase